MPTMSWMPTHRDLSKTKLVDEDVSKGRNQHSTSSNKVDSLVRQIPQGIEEDESKGGSRRRSVDVDQNQRLHYRSTTSTAKEILRPLNFFCAMHHWQLYLCRCHARPRSFNKCHANINLQILEFW
ncbi:hypothetical protein CR513_56964, partial [Mucuna pruriens]